LAPGRGAAGGRQHKQRPMLGRPTPSQAKETHGSKKFHKFYLIDSGGGRHLAATGEDTGDAHYNYASSKPFNKFGTISCHNRREVLLW
jgi:hypothetical protein